MQPILLRGGSSCLLRLDSGVPVDVRQLRYTAKNIVTLSVRRMRQPKIGAHRGRRRSEQRGFIRLGLMMASSQSGFSEAPLTRAEKETQTEAKRLTTQIEDALSAVAVRSRNDIEELEACADRLERAARDLAVALRELARERRSARDETE